MRASRSAAAQQRADGHRARPDRQHDAARTRRKAPALGVPVPACLRRARDRPRARGRGAGDRRRHPVHTADRPGRRQRADRSGRTRARPDRAGDDRQSDRGGSTEVLGGNSLLHELGARPAAARAQRRKRRRRQALPLRLQRPAEPRRRRAGNRRSPARAALAVRQRGRRCRSTSPGRPKRCTPSPTRRSSAASSRRARSPTRSS